MRLGHHRPGPLLATQRAQRDGGYILAQFALLLVPLLLMLSLSVDVGSWYNRASDLQKAADAAALAGVVWLPDEAQARTYARQAAARNGFVHGVAGVTVTVEPTGERRLRVTIRDPRVGSFLYGAFGGDDLDLRRSGTAEYVLPVPLGSPRNFFGTGVLTSGFNENLWLSTNTWCTDKVDGDRFQSPFVGNRPYSSTDSRCPTTHTGQYANPEYRSRGYEYYVDVPTDRTGNIEVLLFDARYNTATFTSDPESALATCTTTWSPSSTGWSGPGNNSNNVTINGPAEYQTRSASSGSNWSSTQRVLWPQSLTHRQDRIRYRTTTLVWSPSSTTWTGPSDGSTNVTVPGPAQYQTRSNSTTTTWSSTVNLAEGSSYSHRRDRIRYRTGALPVTCVDKTVDHMLYSGNHNFTYTLFSADDTPLNDSDNLPVPGCSQTFSADTAFTSGLTFLGTTRWNRLCTITTSMPTGRYVLRVTNTAGSRYAAGANNFAVVAKYTSSPYTAAGALCDARGVSTCPRVYGKDAISVFADQASSTADFFLAEIEPIHVGKKLQIELYDPGEGGDNIRMRRPTGANTWTDATFTWTASNGTSGGPTTSLDVTGSQFNGHNVQLLIDLTGYNPPSTNYWWQIRYNFSSSTVTDRTTWSARVIGDPVHLIEEEPT